MRKFSIIQMKNRERQLDRQKIKLLNGYRKTNNFIASNPHMIEKKRLSSSFLNKII